MTIINICVNGHESRYELFYETGFNRRNAEPEKTYAKWRCSVCSGNHANSMFINDLQSRGITK